MKTKAAYTNTQKEKVALFTNYYFSGNESSFNVYTKKLSDLYNSRTTKYHSVYDTDLFVISRDSESIVAAGYAKSCKAIITLNLENELVKEIIELLKKENQEKLEANEKASWLFASQKVEATKWIQQNPEIVEKEARKVAEKFNREFVSVESMSSREKQQLAWFLLKNFENNTKTAIFHVL